MGEGFLPEDLPHASEHSFRGEESQKHPEEEGVPDARMGPTIAQGLIEAHGGKIEVEKLSQQRHAILLHATPGAGYRKLSSPPPPPDPYSNSAPIIHAESLSVL